MKSLRLPMSLSAGKLVHTSDPNVIARQKILDVLMTSAAERVGPDDYGAAIKSLLFAPIDDLIEADFKLDAISELNRRISGVDIMDMSVRQNPIDQSTAEITVWYRLPLSSVTRAVFTVSTPFLTEESPL